MSNINELIMKKLEGLPRDVFELAVEAVKISESGLPEISIAERLESVVRRIVRGKRTLNDTSKANNEELSTISRDSAN